MLYDVIGLPEAAWRKREERKRTNENLNEAIIGETEMEFFLGMMMIV